MGQAVGAVLHSLGFFDPATAQDQSLVVEPVAVEPERAGIQRERQAPALARAKKSFLCAIEGGYPIQPIQDN